MIKLDFNKKLNGANGEFILNIQGEFGANSITSFFGKSGAGKSTILRILAGLEQPDNGRIIIDNKIVFCSKDKINLPPQKRNIGFIFQDYALFPHLSIYGNLKFALESKSNYKKIDEMIDFMELSNLRDSMPHTLSGGQKQRVALARALLRNSKILLLDEPLSALEVEMKYKLQQEVLRIKEHFGVTIILVSHDISEIYTMSDRILKLENGNIVKDSPPSEFFGNISGKFSFNAKILHIQKNGIISLAKILIANNIITITLDDNTEDLKVGDEVIVSCKAFKALILKMNK